MGYRTSFKLSIYNDAKIDHELLISNFISISENPEKYSELLYKNQDNVICLDDCKWYNWEQHMRELSKLYPNVVFLLDGQGEHGGIWKAYFKNGKFQDVKTYTAFEEFDENKLI